MIDSRKWVISAYDWPEMENALTKVAADDPRLQRVDALRIDYHDKTGFPEVLPELKNVKYLNCHWGTFGQPYIDAIGKMSWLLKLKIGRVRAGDLTPLRNLNELRALSLDRISTAANIQPVFEIPKLQTVRLGISRKIVDLDADGELLSPSLRAIELLGSSDAKQPRIESIEPLASCENLEEIWVKTTTVAKPDLRRFEHLSHLSYLGLSHRMKWDEKHIAALEKKGVEVDREPF